jgi:hypothetical protein
VLDGPLGFDNAIELQAVRTKRIRERCATMARAIAVLNAGSSSLKFAIFLDLDGRLQLLFRGQVEGLFTAPRFLVHDAAGATVGRLDWPEGTCLGHEGAIEHLFVWAAAESRPGLSRRTKNS